MRTIVVGTERSAEGVLKAAYAGRMPAAEKKRALTALLRANPRVDFDALERGTMVRIPDLPGRERSRRGMLDDFAESTVEATRAFAATRVEELVATAGREENAASKERAVLLRALGAREVVAAMRADEQLADEIKAVRENVEEEESRSEARLAALNRVGAEWTERLDLLKKILP